MLVHEVALRVCASPPERQVPVSWFSPYRLRSCSSCFS